MLYLQSAINDLISLGPCRLSVSVFVTGQSGAGDPDLDKFGGHLLFCFLCLLCILCTAETKSAELTLRLQQTDLSLICTEKKNARNIVLYMTRWSLFLRWHHFTHTHTHHLNKRKKVDVFVFIKRPFCRKLGLPVKSTVFPGAKKAVNPLLK